MTFMVQNTPCCMTGYDWFDVSFNGGDVATPVVDIVENTLWRR